MLGVEKYSPPSRSTPQTPGETPVKNGLALKRKAPGEAMGGSGSSITTEPQSASNKAETTNKEEVEERSAE